jgi:poly(3-hydroxybutyrate) depolymerase
MAGACDIIRDMDITLGSGRYTLADPRDGKRSITVHYHRPSNWRGDGPVLVVMHGRNRNGADYRDWFVADAQGYGFLVVAPQFAEAQYAHDDYNYGAMLRDGRIAPRESWLWPVVDHVFRDAAARAGATRGRYFLFGHSAGAQVVHRLATFAWSPLIERAIAANAGSYTLPVGDEDFPFGLRKAPPVDLRALFSRPLLVQLGDQDTDPNHEQLPREPGAMRQGPHRFARGHHYLEVGRREAARLGDPLAWEVEIVPGVAHEAAKMAPFAARALFAR